MNRFTDASFFRKFALELYRRPDVAHACLGLQSRHSVDVNIMLFAAFVASSRRQSLTRADLDEVRRRVSPWQQEVVRPLRAVRQRLKTGPTPAPNEDTGELRRRLAQLEIDAEMIELELLGSLVLDSHPEHFDSSDVDRIRGAIETAVTIYAVGGLAREDRDATETIAREARNIEVVR